MVGRRTEGRAASKSTEEEGLSVEMTGQGDRATAAEG
jgi:hypothetical protein